MSQKSKIQDIIPVLDIACLINNINFIKDFSKSRNYWNCVWFRQQIFFGFIQVRRYSIDTNLVYDFISCEEVVICISSCQKAAFLKMLSFLSSRPNEKAFFKRCFFIFAFFKRCFFLYKSKMIEPNAFFDAIDSFTFKALQIVLFYSKTVFKYSTSKNKKQF